MNAQGSGLINLDYFNNATAAINAAPSCAELNRLSGQLLTSIVAEVEASAISAASAALIGSIDPSSIVNLPTVIAAVKLMVSPYTTAYVTYASQFAATAAAIANLESAITNASSKFSSCSVSFPSIRASLPTLPRTVLDGSAGASWGGIAGLGDALTGLWGDVNDANFQSANALAQVVTIGSDGWLSKGEKASTKIDWADLSSGTGVWAISNSDLCTRAAAIGVSTTAFNTAMTTLSNYLFALSPAWNDTTQDTQIVAATWSTNWSAAYTQRLILINSVTAAKSTVYYQTTAPTGTNYKVGDMWVNTGSTNYPMSTWSGSAWVLAQDYQSAMALLTNIASDGILSQSEKPSTIIDFKTVLAEYPKITTAVAQLGLQTSATAYASAYNTLYAMMTTQVIPAYDDVTRDSLISCGGPTWVTNWQTYEIEKRALLLIISYANTPSIAAVFTTNTGLTTNAGATIVTDGYTWVAGNKVMCIGQTTVAEDGIYALSYTGSGAGSVQVFPTSAADSSGPGAVTNSSYAYNNTSDYASVIATVRGTNGVNVFLGVFDGFSGTATGGVITAVFNVTTTNSDTVAVDYSYDGGVSWSPMGAGNTGVAGRYSDGTNISITSPTLAGITIANLRVRFTVWNSRSGTWRNGADTLVTDNVQCFVQTVRFDTTSTGSTNWALTNHIVVPDQSLWNVAGGTTYGGRQWAAAVTSSTGDITGLTLIPGAGSAPIATTSVAGLVKAGSGLSVAADGTLAVTAGAVWGAITGAAAQASPAGGWTGAAIFNPGAAGNDMLRLQESGVTKWMIYAPTTGKLGFWNASSGLTLTLDASGAATFASTASFLDLYVGGFSGPSKGSIWKQATYGLAIAGTTGSAYDLALLTPAAAVIAYNPTGTLNMAFNGAGVFASSLTAAGVNVDTPSGSSAVLYWKSGGTFKWALYRDTVDNLVLDSDTVGAIASFNRTTGAATFARYVGIGASPMQALTINTASASNALIQMGINGSIYGYLGISAASNSPNAGSVLGDLNFRSQGGSILFSTDSGASSCFKLSVSGSATFASTVTATQHIASLATGNTAAHIFATPGQYIGLGNLSGGNAKIAQCNSAGAWDAANPNMELYLGYNNYVVLHIGNVGTNAATLQAAVASATAPKVGTHAQMVAYTPPTGITTYWYATDDLETDGLYGKLWLWNGSSWVAVGTPSTIAGRITAGVISAGAIGAQAFAADIGLIGSVFRNVAYAAGTYTVPPSGFKFSGTTFSMQLLDGTSMSGFMEIGDNASIGGLKAAVIANRVKGNIFVQNGTGATDVFVPEGVVSVEATLQAAGGAGAAGYGQGGQGGQYIRRKVTVKPHNTYRLTGGAVGSNSTFSWVSFDGASGFTTDSGFATITTTFGASGNSNTGGVNGIDTANPFEEPESGWSTNGATGGEGTPANSGTTAGTGGKVGKKNGGVGPASTATKAAGGGGGASAMADGGNGALNPSNGVAGTLGSGGGSGNAASAGGPAYLRARW